MPDLYAFTEQDLRSSIYSIINYNELTSGSIARDNTLDGGPVFTNICRKEFKCFGISFGKTTSDVLATSFFKSLKENVDKEINESFKPVFPLKGKPLYGKASIYYGSLLLKDELTSDSEVAAYNLLHSNYTTPPYTLDEFREMLKKEQKYAHNNTSWGTDEDEISKAIYDYTIDLNIYKRNNIEVSHLTILDIINMLPKEKLYKLIDESLATAKQQTVETDTGEFSNVIQALKIYIAEHKQDISQTPSDIVSGDTKTAKIEFHREQG